MEFHADLHLRPDLNSLGHTKELVEKSAELGYDAAGVPLPANVTGGEIRSLRDLFTAVGMELVLRVDLAPKDSADMLRKLRNVRRRFEVIAVQCYSKNIARQAAKDRRVDLLSFPSADTRRRFFDHAEAQLAAAASASLEIDMAHLLSLQGAQRSHLLSAFSREALTARKLDVPVVLSSGANEPSLLRKPDEYAFLAYLFGLDLHRARQALSENPHAIIERNRRKLSLSYVAPGVYVIRRGKDCPGV